MICGQHSWHGMFCTRECKMLLYLEMLPSLVRTDYGNAKTLNTATEFRKWACSWLQKNKKYCRRCHNGWASSKCQTVVRLMFEELGTAFYEQHKQIKPNSAPTNDPIMFWNAKELPHEWPNSVRKCKITVTPELGVAWIYQEMSWSHISEAYMRGGCGARRNSWRVCFHCVAYLDQ